MNLINIDLKRLKFWCYSYGNTFFYNYVDVEEIKCKKYKSMFMIRIIFASQGLLVLSTPYEWTKSPRVAKKVAYKAGICFLLLDRSWFHQV